MGTYYSTPLDIPSAKDAKIRSDKEYMDSKKYSQQYIDCTYKIEKSIKNGDSCTFCDYVGPYYTKILVDKGYKTKWHDDDEEIGSRYEISWS